jgi:transcriptional regulator with XRE-family HTH domain
MIERKKYFMDKTTKELLETMKTSKNYYEYLEENGTAINSEKMKPCRALNALLGEFGKKRSDIIAKSCIEKHYAYQIFNGAKIPSRDKMIMLCIAFGLDFERTSELFKVTGYPPLYARDLRDNIIIYCLENKLGVIKANLYLSEKNLPILD